jgi:DNA-binding Xre family transcriptional regulator
MADPFATANPYSQRLQALMAAAGISSYRGLSTTAGVSRWAIDLLRRGQVEQLRVDTLQRLSQALGIRLPDLIAQFGGPEPDSPPSPGPTSVDPLRQEYERLQQRLADQPQEVRRQVQQEAIALLESWLLQWPTAVYAAQQNETIPATRLIPLTRPLEDLLKAWEISPIDTVGAVVAYDPQIHQSMATALEPGQAVRVRYVGYRHGDRLLYRAKVSPVNE